MYLNHKKRIYSFQPTEKGWSRVYLIVMEGADAATWMLRLLPFMGKRRSKQIRKVIQAYGSIPGGTQARPVVHTLRRMVM